MSNLIDYYNDLLSREGIPITPLAHTWPDNLIKDVEQYIEKAVSFSELKGANCKIRPGSTNQSIGNQIEKYTITSLQSYKSLFSIGICTGAGYPDMILTGNGFCHNIPLEVKATSKFNPLDSNRRVLTSSSKKIRSKFIAPIYHLLMTVQYSPSKIYATINAIRIDFLEPTTAVNVRLEASVSHKILSNGQHHTRII